MSSREFWMRIDEIERPGKTCTLYPSVRPPKEAGTWVRVEVAVLPGFKAVVGGAEAA